MNATTLRPWATPLTIVTSLFVGISGLMLFFHLGEGLVKGMHEWIGILMVAAMGMHILVHLNPFKRYFTLRPALAVMLVVALISVTLMALSGGEGGPMMNIIFSVEAAPLTLVAELKQLPVEALIKTLEGAGIVVSDPQVSIAQLAEQSGQHPKELLGLLFSK